MTVPRNDRTARAPAGKWETTMATDKPDLNRRAFLRKATGAAGAATAVAVTASAFVDEAEAYDPGTDETQPKYQPDSPDVQAFYRTNGYETLQDK